MVGTESDSTNLVVEVGLVHAEDALGAELLDYLLGVVVNKVEVSKLALVRENDS